MAITAIETRGLRQVRVRFSTTVSQSVTATGGALRVRDISGGVEFVAPSTLRAPGGAFTAADVGYSVGVVGANDVRNDGYRAVVAVVDGTTATLGGAAVVNEAVSPARVTLSPYVLAPVADAALLSPAFRPVVVAARGLLVEEDVPGAELRDRVQLTLSHEITQTRGYTLDANPIVDLVGGAVPNTPVAFTTETLPRPTGRSFSLWEAMLPEDRAQDASGDLQRLVNVLQEGVDLVLADVDTFVDLNDPRRCRSGLLEALLRHFGNPFAFVLGFSEDRQRDVAEALPFLYRVRGTERGIEDALAFFFGVNFDVIPYIDETPVWTLDLATSLLDLNATLGIDAAWQRYAFDVVSPIVLTVAQRTQVTEIVEFMKPAHTHFMRTIEPGEPGTPAVHWVLDVSAVDGTAILD